MLDLAVVSRFAAWVILGAGAFVGSACDRHTVPHALDAATDDAATEASAARENALERAGGADRERVVEDGHAPKRDELAARSPMSAGFCPEDDAPSVAVLLSPSDPFVGGSVRVLAADFSEEPLSLRLEELGGKSAEPRRIEIDVSFRDGPPAASLARFRPERSGKYRLVVGRGEKGLRCARFSVGERRGKRAPRPADPSSLWPLRRSWTEGEEALYGSWLREMFHAPVGQEIAFSKLDEVTSDPERNLLFDFWGWGEDSQGPMGLRLKPDCADTPYFFRAYFAWKRGLPFGFRSCDSGRPGVAPVCGALHAIAPRLPSEDRPQSVQSERPVALASRAAAGGVVPAGQIGSIDRPDRPDIARLLDSVHKPQRRRDGKSGELVAMQDFFSRTLAWGVHTGNGRTALGNDASDFYPVSLSVHGLRPGTIYADPYGHVLTIVERVPAAPGSQGVLYAVDGQPDGSITRKRFWEGNFLFNPDPALGGSGFKAFRPVVLRPHAEERRLVALRDEEIAHHPGYGDASFEQGSLSPEQFYDRVERLVTPGARDPFLAQEEQVRALAEAARVRVTSIANAQKYFADHPTAVVPMPSGDGIFEATGPWEDFSTPARDLRMLIAMRVVMEFEKKVQRNAEVFARGLGDRVAPDPRDGAAEPKPGSDPKSGPGAPPEPTPRGGPEQHGMRALAAERDRLLSQPDLAFEYTRSDGSRWTISLLELMRRKAAFEAAYNPNDCPEVRWGAPQGSVELSTCRRRAPEDQQRKMEAYRVWFREMRRPPRGDPGPPVP